ncbi:apolipoprotein N-acyltransferase [Cellulomonas carbonis]|uniref:Apolipoprotein N-acyltransferase n=1 Tax=Cellulomonas carbonis T26 TaxID=947969 RepID=A0A0A0BUV9_9CELL|nr:apolipoprotein N-acyltransferase [Cellulomonas carbonis]KGM11725.1 acyltransferase [Cellulomonas carbonis T26]GGB94488.1 apolipoprotein N-acyltransferase [Cellulomonas carbonis]
MLQPTPRRLTTVVAAIVGGLATDAAFPGLGLWPLAFVGVALLFLALGRDSARWNALIGFLFGLAFFLPHIAWAEYAVGPVPWFALSIAEAGFVGLFAAGWSWARRGAAIRHRAHLQVPTFAILWVGVEELRSVWPFGGFPWGRLAFSQADAVTARWAWAGGVPLLSAVVVVAGVCLALAVLAVRRLDLGTASGAVLVGLAVVGSGLLVPLDTRAEEGTLAVGAVQGNVPNRGLDSFAQEREVLENHVAGTERLADEVGSGTLDLVLWPENGSDVDPRVDEGARRAVDRAAQAVDAPVLVGTLEYPSTGGRYNVALLWDPQEGPLAAYAKQRPAAFAEYVPMREIARRFSDAVDRVRRDMLPGDEVGLVEVPSERLGRIVPIGVGICFEVAYDGIMREGVRAGAEIVVVPTNNATFGVTDESTQQLAMSRIRAIEHGRATVQVSTVGVSAVITPNGRVTRSTDLFTADTMVADLALRTGLTPATRYGDVVAWTFRALAVVVVVAGAAGAARLRREASAGRQRAAGPRATSRQPAVR